MKLIFEATRKKKKRAESKRTLGRDCVCLTQMQIIKKWEKRNIYHGLGYHIAS